MLIRKASNTIELVLRRIWRDHRGGAGMLAVIGLPAVIGGLAFAIDTGYLFLQRRLIQQQADTAAVAAAAAKFKGVTTLTTLRSLAILDATRNGFAPSATSTLAMNAPPVSGPYSGSATAVEVIIDTEVKTFFARHLNLAAVSIRGRAVAGYAGAPSGGGGCVMALDRSASRALRFQGSGSLLAPTCTLVSNSSASNAILVGGNETVKALALYTAGNVEVGPSAVAEISQGIYTNKAPVADPYASLSVAAASGCMQTNFSVHGNNPNRNIDAGTYCNGLEISGSGTVYMKKGTYTIKGGDFKVSGTARVRCGNCTSTTDGVTIVLQPGLNGSVGSVSIAGTTDVQLSAPSGADAGTLRGIAIYQDRAADAGNAAKLTGSSNMRVSGVIYMPSADINFSGTSDLPDGKACVLIIGRTVEVQGNSRLALSDCQAMGARQIDTSSASPILLE